MINTLRRQLIAVVLLVAVLLLPLNSISHEMPSGVSQERHACQLMLIDFSTDEEEKQSNHFPGNNADSSCECGECCPDATEPPDTYDMRLTFSARQLFRPNTAARIPEVYIAIFVPPQNYSWM